MHCGPAGAGGRQLAAKILHRFIHAGFELHVSVFKRGNGSHLRHDEILPSKMKTRIIKQRAPTSVRGLQMWVFWSRAEGQESGAEPALSDRRESNGALALHLRPGISGFSR